MKKILLVAFTVVPVILGYISNISLMSPEIGLSLFKFLSLVQVVFWFYLGMKYFKASWNFIQSLFIAHWIGIISLTIYFWQFYWLSGSSRNFLAGLSQDFIVCTSLFTAKIAQRFEAEENLITQTTFTAMQILGLLLMVIIFIIGYICGKIREKLESKSNGHSLQSE